MENRKQNLDRLKQYHKKYYQEHKEEIYEQQKEWRKNNKDKVLKSIAESRKRRIERLKADGVTNPWGVVIRGSKPKYRKEV